MEGEAIPGPAGMPRIDFEAVHVEGQRPSEPSSINTSANIADTPVSTPNLAATSENTSAEVITINDPLDIVVPKTQEERSIATTPENTEQRVIGMPPAYITGTTPGDRADRTTPQNESKNTNISPSDSDSIYPAFGEPSRFPNPFSDPKDYNEFGVRTLWDSMPAVAPKPALPKRKEKRKKEKHKPPKQVSKTEMSENNPADWKNWFSNAWTVMVLTLIWGTGQKLPIWGGIDFTDDDIANALKNSEGVRRARDYFYNKYRGRISPKSVLTNYDYDFGLPGLLNAGIDPVEQFIGSFQVEIKVVDGNKLEYTITNTTSFTSASLHIGPSWENGPMGNFSQSYTFTEPIIGSPNIYNSRACAPNP